MASKKRTIKPPPVPVPAKGKKTSAARKPLKKLKAPLGPGVHHADHSKQKSFPVTAVTSPAGTTTDAYARHTNRSARVYPPPTRA
jgi:hypothetical protein